MTAKSDVVICHPASDNGCWDDSFWHNYFPVDGRMQCMAAKIRADQPLAENPNRDWIIEMIQRTIDKCGVDPATVRIEEYQHEGYYWYLYMGIQHGKPWPLKFEAALTP